MARQEQTVEQQIRGADMKCELRKWRLTDAKALSAVLNNKKVLNNLVCSLSSRQMKKVKFALRLNVEEHFLCRVLIILIVLF